MSIETDVVDAQIEAFQARDVERFLSHYADDASVVMFDGTVMFGSKEVMREQYGKLFADSPDLQVSIASRIRRESSSSMRNTSRAFTSVTCRPT